MARTIDLKGLFIGAIVSDAASVNSHWIYPSFTQFEQFQKDANGKPEFMEKIYNPFYRGQPSPYGEQILVLMESLAECKGWNRQHFKRSLYKAFNKSTRYYDTTLVEEPLAGTPVRGGYPNKSIRLLVEKYDEEGEFSNSAFKGDYYVDGVVKAVILAYYYLGTAEYMAIIKECVEITQDDPEALNSALATASLFELVFSKNKLDYELLITFINGNIDNYWISKEINEMLLHLNESLDDDLLTYAKSVGIHCKAMSAFTISLHVLINELKLKNPPQETFINALRKNMSIGGCNCSRNIIIGALLAGFYGECIIPISWIEKTNDTKRALNAVVIIQSQ